jgi:hypothetical protein
MKQKALCEPGEQSSFGALCEKSSVKLRVSGLTSKRSHQDHKEDILSCESLPKN